MNLFMKQKQIHRHRKQTYGYQGGKRGGGRDKLASVTVLQVVAKHRFNLPMYSLPM